MGAKKTVERGYGATHKRLRRMWEPRVAAGYVACARCRRLIVPGESWDLGHADNDRSQYAGPEHRRCNRSTASRRPRAATVSFRSMIPTLAVLGAAGRERKLAPLVAGVVVAIHCA
jgi:hypothetical protein